MGPLVPATRLACRIFSQAPAGANSPPPPQMANIPYSLIDNKLTTDPNDLRAQVRITATVSINDLIDAIVRPGSTVTKAEFLAMWEELGAEVVRCLLRGESVVTDLFTVRPALTGVWANAQDSFDPTRHHGRLRLGTGVRLRRAEAQMQFELERAQDQSRPLPVHLEDFASDTTNATLTKGGVVRLTGSLLKVDAADPDQGIFLVNSTGAATRVTKVMTNKPSEQLFMVPATLAAGTYQVEVRTKIKGSSQLKTAALGVPVQVA